MDGICRRFDLEVSHFLTSGVHEKHKCRRVHGHRYELEIWVAGELGDDGMLVEYDDLDRVILPVLRLLDHYSANTLAERCTTKEAEAVTANPTVERLGRWLVARLSGIVASAVSGRRLKLAELRLGEDRDSGYRWAQAPGASDE